MGNRSVVRLVLIVRIGVKVRIFEERKYPGGIGEMIHIVKEKSGESRNETGREGVKGGVIIFCISEQEKQLCLE